MKKMLLIAALTIALNINASADLTDNNTEYRNCTVIEHCKNTVLVTDPTGDIYKFKTDIKYSNGDTIRLLFDTNGTDNKSDDVIIF